MRRSRIWESAGLPHARDLLWLTNAPCSDCSWSSSMGPARCGLMCRLGESRPVRHTVGLRMAGRGAVLVRTGGTGPQHDSDGAVAGRKSKSHRWHRRWPDLLASTSGVEVAMLPAYNASSRRRLRCGYENTNSGGGGGAGAAEEDEDEGEDEGGGEDQDLEEEGGGRRGGGFEFEAEFGPAVDLERAGEGEDAALIR